MYCTRSTWQRAFGDRVAAHELAASARRLSLTGDLVVSHESAALLHGFALLQDPTEPRLTLARAAGRPPPKAHGLYTAAVPPVHRELRLPRLPVTTPPRTVADCLRVLPPDASLVLADSALRRGVDRLDVLDVLSECQRWPGARAALDVMARADRRAQSALESLARGWFSAAGLPVPDLQVVVVRAADGRFLAEVDFLWRRYRTVCEVDGRLKYDVDEPGEGDPLWQEKLREDGLRDSGLEVVRGYWSDRSDSGRRLVQRLTRAFGRGERRQDPPEFGTLSRVRWPAA